MTNAAPQTGDVQRVLKIAANSQSAVGIEGINTDPVWTRRSLGRGVSVTPTTKIQLPYLKVTGVDSYVEIASIADYSIATTGELSVSAWMRPDTLNFPRWEETGCVYWLGKGDSGKQEWAFRTSGSQSSTFEWPG